jgi:hypothetical protein
MRQYKCFKEILGKGRLNTGPQGCITALDAGLNSTRPDVAAVPEIEELSAVTIC